MIDSVQHKVILYLLNFKQAQDKTIQIDEEDSEGWVIKADGVEGLQSSTGPLAENLRDKHAHEYLGHALIERRTKQTPGGCISCKQEKGWNPKTKKPIYVKRSLNAYRVKRDRNTWTKLYAYFVSRADLRKFIEADYTRSLPYLEQYSQAFYKALTGTDLCDGYQTILYEYPDLFLKFLQDEQRTRFAIEQAHKTTRTHFLNDKVSRKDFIQAMSMFNNILADAYAIAAPRYRAMNSAWSQYDPARPNESQEAMNKAFDNISKKYEKTNTEEVAGKTQKTNKTRRANYPSGPDAATRIQEVAVSSPLLPHDPRAEYVDLVYIGSSPCEMEVWDKKALED